MRWLHTPRKLRWIVGLLLIGVGDMAHGAGEPEPAPDGWRRSIIREEIAPQFRVERSNAGSGHAYRLGMSGRGDDAVDGRWIRTTPVEAGRYYEFRAEYLAKNVPTPSRSILARVIWLDAKGAMIDQAEYPLTSPERARDGWTLLTTTYQAPARATTAQLELHLRWAGQGDVVWRGAGLNVTEAPSPRKVRLASINHRVRGSRSPEANLDEYARLIGEAAAQKADIVCLPEGITVVGSSKKYAEVAEAIPGPSTRFLGEVAKKHRLYLVAGLYERSGTTLYNTSVLIGRDGSLVGKYRKVCLPREEIDGGITPGSDYPVFDTDFGRIGMMICWDLHFPEVARELASRGAEVIFLPIWGGNETLARARAIENQVLLVASGYDFNSAIYDRAGHPLAEATADPAVLVTEVDLNERLLWPWLGDWRARIWREGPARAETGR